MTEREFAFGHLFPLPAASKQKAGQNGVDLFLGRGLTLLSYN
jgi:hypothetical protein